MPRPAGYALYPKITTIPMTEAMRQAIATRAAEQGVSMSQAARELIEAGLAVEGRVRSGS